MSPLRRLLAACAIAATASGLLVTPLLTAPASAAELLQDGGFEAATGDPANSPSWTEADNLRGSPLCTPSFCGSAGGTSLPRTGNNWARFGGVDWSGHTASISQSVTIPAGTATLSYWYRNGQVASPFTATLQVRVDGTTVQTNTEASSPQSSYSQQTVDLSAYADGASHTIAFVYANNATGTNRMIIDDVSLDHTAPTVTATPTVTETVPASPSSSTTPRVRGTAEAGSTVTLYANDTCTSGPLGAGPASDFEGAGITTTVPADATTTIFANASKSGQTTSACSSTSVSYTNDSTPPASVVLTQITPASPNQSTTPVIQGTADPGSTVNLYTTGDCTGSPAATGTAAAFSSPGLQVTVAPDSTSTFRATATDSVGNTSPCSTSSLTYQSDSTGPVPVMFTGSTPASPDPSTTPLIRGTAEPGSTVNLYLTPDCTGAPAATGSAESFGSPGLPVTVAVGSTTTFTARATDAAGNTSACSTSSLTYINDSTGPAPVTLTGSTPASPSPSTTPLIQGTAEAGSTVNLYATGDCTGAPAATGTAAAFASPGLAVTVAPDSTTTFTGTATDPAGNTSTCSSSSLSYTNDSTEPASVDLTGVTPSSPNPSTTPSIQGTAEAGSTVNLYATGDCTGAPAATGTAAAFASPGLPATVAVGSTTTFTATATDPAGNTSACSTSSLTYRSDLFDGGFEAATGDPADSPFWTETDSLTGSPLCTIATCSTGDGITAPRTGNAWAWFGGIDGPLGAGQAGSVSQQLAIPVGAASLTYWYRNASEELPFDAQLRVQVDGTTVKTHTEASQPDPAYVRQFADLSPYADGALHTISFKYTNGVQGLNSMLVDDVGLSTVPSAHTDMPTVSATVPASPASSTNPPRVFGSAETGSTVTLYANSSCSGPALGVGTAVAFANDGITATVPANAITTIFAQASVAGKSDSPCSATFVSYTQGNPHTTTPETTLTRTPKKKVFTKKRKRAVVFAFASTAPGATFQCSIDGKAFKACTSGRKYKLKVGKHTFAVRALATDLTDPTPATYGFKIKRKH